MMKLSLMKQFFDTVDDNYRSPIADQIVKRWKHDEESCQIFRASANFICVFTNQGETYYLRLINERDIKEMEAEVELLNYLKETLAVAEPIMSIQGSYVERVETDLGVFYASVTREVKGKSLELETLTPKQFYTWGNNLGRLHETIKNNPKEKLYRKTWQEQLAQASHAIQDEKVLEVIQIIKKEMENLPITEANYGLIHFDFELDNLMWDEENKISIIDFDDCSYHWFASDIIYALRDLMVDHRLVVNDSVKQFLIGYEKATSLDYDVFKQHKTLYGFHLIYTYARLLEAVDLDESSEQPKWMIQLIHKLNQRLTEFREAIIKLNDQIQYKTATIEDLSSQSFDHFIRYEKVEFAWRTVDERMVLRPVEYTEQWEQVELRQVLEELKTTIKNKGKVFIALERDQIIGFASLEGKTIGSHNQYHQLSMLHVDSERRGRGIGRKLFELCVEALKTFGGSKMYVSSSSSENSQRYYRLMGCVQASEVIPELYLLEPYDRHLEYDLHVKPNIYLADLDEEFEFALSLLRFNQITPIKELNIAINSEKKVIVLDEFPIGVALIRKTEETYWIDDVLIDQQFVKEFQIDCNKAVIDECVKLVNNHILCVVINSQIKELVNYLKTLDFKSISPHLKIE
jgi:Ser/Thr protein kinase RdoA (MazF antagonist)/ribosomal protein S18 acetylase RimI-like enzyme